VHYKHGFQALCPSLGKKKIAAILARAGLHLGVSTVAAEGYSFGLYGKREGTI